MNHETVCCDCRTPFVPLKNDIIVNEVNDEGMSVRLWCADLWNCPSCGHRMIKGWGQNPIAEHYEEGYEASLSKCKATGVMFTVCNQRGRLSEWDGSTN
jgi:uncharacterized protein with PIN domain